MVLSATAFTASSRGTSSNAVVKRAGRSITLDAPISMVNANSIQVLDDAERERGAEGERHRGGERPGSPASGAAGRSGRRPCRTPA